MTQPVSRLEAQQRADAIETFRREMERLEREGVLALTDAQRQAVTEHHHTLLASYGESFDIDRDAGAKQLSLGMRVASFLGALALSTSVFLLFYQFWGSLTTLAQVTILIVGAVATFAVTMWVNARDASGYFTNLAAMVALACFVLDISTLGQIFNITPTDTALVAWSAMALLLAYTCDLRLLLAAGIVLAIGYLSTRIGAWCGIHWLQVGERPENFIPAGVLLFLVPHFIRHDRFAGFPPIYRMIGLVAVLLPMLILSTWGVGSYTDFDRDTVERVYQVLGFAACACAIWLGIRGEWRETVNVGVVFFVLFLYMRFFDWWWDTMPKYLFFLILGLTAVAMLLVLRHARARGLHVIGGTA